MNEEKIRSNVDAALNVETFNVLDYLEDQPVATDEVTIYTNVSKARALHKLMEERAVILAERRRAIENDDYGDLSITDAAEDTDLDDEINGVIAELERSGIPSWKLGEVSMSVRDLSGFESEAKGVKGGAVRLTGSYA